MPPAQSACFQALFSCLRVGSEILTDGLIIRLRRTLASLWLSLIHILHFSVSGHPGIAVHAVNTGGQVLVTLVNAVAGEVLGRTAEAGILVCALDVYKRQVLSPCR